MHLPRKDRFAGSENFAGHSYYLLPGPKHLSLIHLLFERDYHTIDGSFYFQALTGLKRLKLGDHSFHEAFLDSYLFSYYIESVIYRGIKRKVLGVFVTPLLSLG